MSIVTPPNIDEVSGSIFRLSVEQYHELGAAGILATDDRVELLEGLLVQKMTKYPPHVGTVLQLRDRLEPLLPIGWRYRSEQPLILSDGEPEPDGVIARGSPADNFRKHPLGPETLLVIEVSESSLTLDRGIKLRSYARARIPTYWIVNLIDRQIEVFTAPDSTASPVPTYRGRTVLAAEDRISLIVADVQAEFAVSDLLPPI